jgi:hypothetical protein
MEDRMRRLILIVLVMALAACAAPVPTPTPIVPVATSTSLPPTIAAQTPLDYRAAMKPEFAAEVDRFGDATRYQIDLTIAPDMKSYTATQIVTYTNVETATLKEVYFRLFPNSPAYGGQLKITSLRANGVNVTPKYELDNTAMRIDLAQPLKPGDVIEFEMAYMAQVPTEEVEIGYNRFGWHDSVLTLPGFYPLIPVYDDEGWNVEVAPPQGDTVFSDTALYRVNITAPSDQVVVTSGSCSLAKGSEPSQDFQTVQCVSGPMRDFMIAMSADYEVKSQVVDGVKLNSYYLKDDAQAGARVGEAQAAAVESYDQRIGTYPFSEFDVVETPTSAGGIEYPGLVVIAESLYKKESDFLEGVVAHETAHQWWYSLVGNDQIDEPWLDEAFAQFTTGLYYRDRYGAAALPGYVEQALASRYATVKGTDQDKRADLPVGAYSERQYSAIVYGKAALLFNALYEALGDAKFNQFMQDYFQTYRYGVAYPQDLFAIAAKYVGQAKLDELVREWITGP